MRTNLIENRQIRIFISSTFRDMMDERDYLMKRTFPKLRKLAAERDVTLTELDLRWGITEEEAQRGKVVGICLCEIENSIPFFVGIIGNRYGWIPQKSDIAEGVTDRFKDVRQYLEDHLSVTEMEMQFGVLSRKEDMHAYFFIKAQEEEYDNTEMLKRLKQEVRDSKYPSCTYSSPEHLAQLVEEAFTSLLDQLFPKTILSELEKERIGQRSFMNQLCQNYIKDQRNFDVLDQWINDENQRQLVVTGESGLGKSALIANWLKKELDKKDRCYNIIYHFTGNGGSESSRQSVSKVLCEEIRDQYGWKEENTNDTSKENELQELFTKVTAEGDKTLLIVIDAINQIIDTENAKLLNWLPTASKKIKILYSTLEDDTTMEVFKNRNYPVFTLQPLDKERRRSMVVSYLKLYAKSLKETQVERIITDLQCKNTLVLKTLLDKLISFGLYEKIEERIDYFLNKKSIEEFFDTLIEDSELEFKDYGKNFVKQILSLISVSKYGLAENELLTILNTGCKVNQPQISQLAWSQFFCSFATHLVTKNGLLFFIHNYISKVVANRYQQDGQWENECRLALINYFKGQQTPRAWKELLGQYTDTQQYDNLHRLVSNISVFESLMESCKYELGKCWSVLLAKGYSADALFENAKSISDRADRMKVCGILSPFFRDICIQPQLALKAIEEGLKLCKEESEKAWFYDEKGLVKSLVSEYWEALRYKQQALSIRESTNIGNRLDIAKSYKTIGDAYSKLGEHKEALAYKQKALQIKKDQLGPMHTETAITYKSIGDSYSKLGVHDKALAFKLKALEIMVPVLGEYHHETAITYISIGDSYSKLGVYDKSLEYKQKGLSFLIKLFGENHRETAIAYRGIGDAYSKLNIHDRALEYKTKALQLLLALFGEKHHDTAITYKRIGDTYGKLGENQKALQYKTKAVELLIDIFGEKHPDIATTYNSIGDSYNKMKQYELAIATKIKAVNMFIEIFGEKHKEIAKIYKSISNSYAKMGNMEKALEYKQKYENQSL